MPDNFIEERNEIAFRSPRVVGKRQSPLVRDQEIAGSSPADPTNGAPVREHPSIDQKEVTEMDMTMTTEALFDTQGVTVAYLNPTPRLALSSWSCAGYGDPDVFSPTDEDQLLQAQEVCGDCAVRELCLELGVSRDEWGVWGGVLLESGKPLATVKRPGRPRKVSA